MSISVDCLNISDILNDQFLFEKKFANIVSLRIDLKFFKKLHKYFTTTL